MSLGGASGSGPIAGTGGALGAGLAPTGGAAGTGGVEDAGATAGSGAGAGGSVGVAGVGGSVGAPEGGSGVGGSGGNGAAGSVGQSAGTGGAEAGGASTFDPCPSSGDCKVLPLGDSITYGSPTNNGGYRVELFSRAHMDGKHLTFVGSQLDGPTMVAGVTFPRANEGHPGWTIAQIANIADATQALAGSPQIVLLHIGTNDMGSMSAGAPDRLDQLVDEITAVLPDALIAVSSIIPLPWTNATVMAYNATIPGMIEAKAAQGKHVIYVEMFEGFPPNGLASDNIHPNDDIGYPWMGDTWYAAIEGYLR